MMGKSKIAIAPDPTLTPYSSLTTNPPILPKGLPKVSRAQSIGTARYDGRDCYEMDTKNAEQEKYKDVVMKNVKNGGKSFNTGRWTRLEKRLFLEGLRQHGKGRWKQIGKVVNTRSLIQIKSHAQKVLKKLEAGEDVFAVLDDYLDCSEDESQSKCIESTIIPETVVTNSSNSINAYARAASSKFAWILPSGPNLVNNPSNDSLEPERKRKERKKEPKSKMTCKKFRGSVTGNNIESADSVDSRNTSDTSLAAQALSTLFLRQPPAIKDIRYAGETKSTGVNSNQNRSFSEEPSARVEDARILLSLMGKDKHNPDTSSEVMAVEAASTSRSPTSYFWRS